MRKEEETIYISRYKAKLIRCKQCGKLWEFHESIKLTCDCEHVMNAKRIRRI